MADIHFVSTAVHHVDTNRNLQEPSDVPRDVRKRVIKVHRLNVKRGLIDIFKDPYIMEDSEVNLTK